MSSRWLNVALRWTPRRRQLAWSVALLLFVAREVVSSSAPSSSLGYVAVAT